MNNKKILLIVLGIVLGISVLLIIYFNKRSASLLPDGSKLVKSSQFYNDKRSPTLEYLNKVYPTATESFKNMSSKKLAIFYNSLWFYYNCEAKYNSDTFHGNAPDGPPIKRCWQALPGCGSTLPKLPYTPQGYLYSFNSWIYNWQPWIKSVSDINPEDITSFAPGGWLWNWTSGPSPMFEPQRCIHRMIYNKDDPNFVNKIKQPALLPGEMGKWSSYWNYPNKWWLGIPDNGYIEVIGSDEPGMALSAAAIWLNGIVGTGIFYNVGKSKIARNKVDGTFLLAQEMAQTDAGKKALQDNYNTTDPYDVVALLLGSGDNGVLFVQQKAPLVWDPVNNKTTECNWNKGALGANNIVSIPSDRNGWNNSTIIDTLYWSSWCSEKTANSRKFAYGLPNKCIDDARFGNTYPADRIAAFGTFDEPITWMGTYLGYDSIQMLQSANGAGFWQVEIIHLKDLPNSVKNRDYSEYIANTTNGKKCSGDFGNVAWRTDVPFFESYMKKLYENFTLRDPTDVYNDFKATNCLVPNPWTIENHSKQPFNITCKNNLSDIYTNLSFFNYDIYGKYFNQCTPDGIGAEDQIMTNKDIPPYG